MTSNENGNNNIDNEANVPENNNIKLIEEVWQTFEEIYETIRTKFNGVIKKITDSELKHAQEIHECELKLKITNNHLCAVNQKFHNLNAKYIDYFKEIQNENERLTKEIRNENERLTKENAILKKYKKKPTKSKATKPASRSSLAKPLSLALQIHEESNYSEHELVIDYDTSNQSDQGEPEVNGQLVNVQETANCSTSNNRSKSYHSVGNQSSNCQSIPSKLSPNSNPRKMSSPNNIFNILPITNMQKSEYFKNSKKPLGTVVTSATGSVVGPSKGNAIMKQSNTTPLSRISPPNQMSSNRQQCSSMANDKALNFSLKQPTTTSKDQNNGEIVNGQNLHQTKPNFDQYQKSASNLTTIIDQIIPSQDSIWNEKPSTSKSPNRNKQSLYGAGDIVHKTSVNGRSNIAEPQKLAHNVEIMRVPTSFQQHSTNEMPPKNIARYSDAIETNHSGRTSTVNSHPFNPFFNIQKQPQNFPIPRMINNSMLSSSIRFDNQNCGGKLLPSSNERLANSTKLPPTTSSNVASNQLLANHSVRKDADNPPSSNLTNAGLSPRLANQIMPNQSVKEALTKEISTRSNERLANSTKLPPTTSSNMASNQLLANHSVRKDADNPPSSNLTNAGLSPRLANQIMPNQSVKEALTKEISTRSNERSANSTKLPPTTSSNMASNQLLANHSVRKDADNPPSSNLTNAGLSPRLANQIMPNQSVKEALTKEISTRSNETNPNNNNLLTIAPTTTTTSTTTKATISKPVGVTLKSLLLISDSDFPHCSKTGIAKTQNKVSKSHSQSNRTVNPRKRASQLPNDPVKEVETERISKLFSNTTTNERDKNDKMLYAQSTSNGVNWSLSAPKFNLLSSPTDESESTSRPFSSKKIKLIEKNNKPFKNLISDNED